uniref:GH18 domain-containing protein n=1 Tax=Acrobeloides nanus TaxID=290746 RepID=A0A914CYA1_9BILA
MGYKDICWEIKRKNLQSCFDNISKINHAITTKSSEFNDYNAFKQHRFLFEGFDSIKSKIETIKRFGFGGVFIWNLAYDDYSGECHESYFPLTTFIYENLIEPKSFTNITVSNDPTCYKRPLKKLVNFCPMNWHYLASTKSCYFLEFFVDYQRANESCAKRDSTLAIIPNEEVQNFIWTLKDIDPVHSESGLIDTEGILIERIVNIDQKENLTVWLDETKFGFNKFNGSNETFTDAKCTHITMENTWKQLDCDVIMDIAV